MIQNQTAMATQSEPNVAQQVTDKIVTLMTRVKELSKENAELKQQLKDIREVLNVTI